MCYLNVCVQLIADMPGAAEALAPVYTTSKDAVVQALGALVSAVCTTTAAAQSPDALYQAAIRSQQTRVAPTLQAGRQNDAAETLVALLDRLRDCADLGTQLANPFAHACRLVESVALLCGACGRTHVDRRPSQTTHYALQLHFDELPQRSQEAKKSPVTLQALISAHTASGFFPPEFPCPRCKVANGTERTVSIASAPPTLLIELGRFGANLEKNHTEVALPHELRHPSLPGLPGFAKGDGPRYLLRGVIVHLGQRPDSGHYTYAHVTPASVVWEFNDACVQPLAQGLDSSQLRRGAYVLLYVRE